MTTTAILAILLSAFIHAGWNLLSKRSRPSIPFFLWASISSAVLLTPVSFIYLDLISEISPIIWLLLLLAGGFQALYYTGLTGAYQQGEISVIYPMVRALPVLTVAGVSIVLGRGSQLSVISVFGMGLVAIGCWLLPQGDDKAAVQKNSSPGSSSGLKLLSGREYLQSTLGWALLAVIGTTGYTVTDDMGLALMRGASNAIFNVGKVTLVYEFLETVLTLPWLLGLAFLLLRTSLSTQTIKPVAWRHAIAAGIMIFTAYGLVLFAMAYVRDVSYVSAFRQVSIPIGAGLGILVEKESLRRQKIAGLICILTGLILVAVG